MRKFIKSSCHAVMLDGEASKIEVARFHGYCDGNFRLPHLVDAGTAAVHEPPLQHRFLQDKEVEAFVHPRKGRRVQLLRIIAMTSTQTRSSADPKGNLISLVGHLTLLLLCHFQNLRFKAVAYVLTQLDLCLENRLYSFKILSSGLLCCRCFWGLLPSWDVDLRLEYDDRREVELCNVDALHSTQQQHCARLLVVRLSTWLR